MTVPSVATLRHLFLLRNFENPAINSGVMSISAMSPRRNSQKYFSLNLIMLAYLSRPSRMSSLMYSVETLLNVEDSEVRTFLDIISFNYLHVYIDWFCTSFSFS